MKIGFDKVNETGGVEDHQIELIEKDDAYEPADRRPT